MGPRAGMNVEGKGRNVLTLPVKELKSLSCAPNSLVTPPTELGDVHKSLSYTFHDILLCLIFLRSKYYQQTQHCCQAHKIRSILF
jgi:hypothetical protein